MPSADQVNRRYFREAYRTGEHGWEIEEPSPCAVEFLKEARKHVPGERLLDIGCGEGRHCVAAARLGFRVTGIDFEYLALKRASRFARMKHAKGIRFRQANVLSLPFARRRFC